MNKEIFNQAYKHIVELWPSVILTSDNKTLSNGGANIPSLWSVYELIDEKVATDPEFDNCRNVGTSWTLRVKRKHMEAHHDKNRRKRIEA